MTTPDFDALAATATLSHALTVPTNTTKPSTVMTDDCYERIQGRIRVDLGKQSPSVWIGAAFTFIGVAVSAALAVLVLPRKVTDLPDGTRPILIVIGVSAALLALVCLLAHRATKKGIETIAADICSEMDTYSYKALGDEHESSGGNQAARAGVP
jgi:hypothetical protein